jgi:hypothetical protein
MLKPIQKYFAMSNILLYEPLADQTIMTLMQKLDQSFAATGDACHFDDWLLYCETTHAGHRSSFFWLLG